MISVPDCSSADIDLAQVLRPGDRIAIGQGAAEPLSLVKALIEQIDGLPRLGVFVGQTFSGLIDRDFARKIDLASTLGIGILGELADEGLLDLVPTNYGDLPRMMAEGPYAPSVVMVQVAPADASGYHSFGVSVDHAAEATRHARVIIAEVNDQMPSTVGSARLHPSQITTMVRTSRPLIEVPPPVPSASDRTIGKHVASLIPQGATIQLGIGGVPSAVAQELRGNRDLHVYSGLVGDWLLELARGGSLDLQPHWNLVSTGSVVGSQELYDFVAQSRGVVLDPIGKVNRFDVIQNIPKFVAINSALQVDLTGQVNAEAVNGRYIGAIGGQTDFMRGAQLSVGGRSVIAMRATSSGGTHSRIVPQLDYGCVTTPKAYVDYVVTEHGVAELKGRSLRQRAEALIEIAAPELQGNLRASLAGRAYVGSAP